MNNREWLTSLSDEEFADIFFNGCCDTCAYGRDAATYVNDCEGDCVNGILGWLRAEHEEPDTWERIEADAPMRAVDYYEARIGDPCVEIGAPEIIVAQKLDLVRRCKALADTEAEIHGRTCANCTDGGFECSECGFFDAYMPGDAVRYCPNCGAKLIQEVVE